MSVISKMKEMQSELTAKEKKISKYILQHLDKIVYMNTYQIADKCKVSQASVVRFAKKLGYSGFPEFKISFGRDMGRRDVEEKINFIYEDIQETDELDDLIKKIAYANSNIIQDTYSILDTNTVKEAVEIIKNARKIFILGAGYSGIVAKDFHYKLGELGMNSICEADYHIQLASISTLNENDVVFVISQGGKTVDIYNLVKEAKKRKAKIISVTQMSSNPIRDLADIKISTIMEKNNFRSTALSSRIAQLTIIDIIYVALITENKELAEKYIGDAMKLVSDFKM